MIPDAAAWFFAKQFEGKARLPAHMGAALAERRNQIKEVDAAFSKARPVRPATLSSYARQGGSLLQQRRCPPSTVPGRWSWDPNDTHHASSSTPGCWTAK